MSIQARYVRGTAAYERRLVNQRLNNRHWRARQAAKRDLILWAPRPPKGVPVVHARIPAPLRGTVALGLFYGLRRKVAA